MIKICNESLLDKIEYLPKKIKLSLEKNKIIEISDNNKTKLPLFINNCLKEKNAQERNGVIGNIKKFKKGSYKIIEFSNDKKFNLIK